MAPKNLENPAQCIRNIKSFLLVRHVFAEIRTDHALKDHYILLTVKGDDVWYEPISADGLAWK